MSYLIQNYGRFGVELVRGRGCEVWDSGGKRYLDFGGGIAVCSLGHASPVMQEVLARQSGELVHCSNLYQVPQQEELARVLVEDVMELEGRCLFCNSGAEANEALLKVARRYGQVAKGGERTEILTFSGSFHGRTFGGMSATAQEKIRCGFGPTLPGFDYLPFNDVDALRNRVNEKTAAVLLEPVQGEGGIHVATPEFLQAAAEVCREKGALLMFDEVQCGIGRVGAMCGWKAILEGTGIAVEPDAVSWAKGMGGGYPVGAIWCSDREVETVDGAVGVSGLIQPGMHGTTYGGGPMTSAVAAAVIGTIRDEGLCERSRVVGERIVEEVSGWGSSYLKGVRGKGLMIGFVLDEEALGGMGGFSESGKAASVFVVDRLNGMGLLTVPAGGDVVRWLPALTVSDGEVEEALGIFREFLGLS